MIFHSDRGSQYTSALFRQALARYGAIQSMSNTGKCFDNARMESFFATLKKDSIYKFKTEAMKMEIVKSIVFRFIEVYYNRKRIYTTNGGYPPLIKRTLSSEFIFLVDLKIEICAVKVRDRSIQRVFETDLVVEEPNNFFVFIAHILNAIEDLLIREPIRFIQLGEDIMASFALGAWVNHPAVYKGIQKYFVNSKYKKIKIALSPFKGKKR